MNNKPCLYDLIYAIARQVPPGEVATYEQIARLAGRCSAQTMGVALASLVSCRDHKDFEEIAWQLVITPGNNQPARFRNGQIPGRS